ncbi:Pex24p-domain-containing protein [Venturia nashicola]|uniref:Pex24p-domain-containing protein n=1 Tax=Venturia nashicola TaxID=86259 RepID=A0A4Z1P812_9PEZI|nr:Pex24p-domain-containing protein [Venturia nashicola]
MMTAAEEKLPTSAARDGNTSEHNNTKKTKDTEDIPAIQVTKMPTTSPDGNRSASSSSRIEQIREASSRAADKVRDKLADMEGKKVENPVGMQDRLMNILMSQIIPSSEQNGPDAANRSSRKTVNRPSFSLPAMSNNFRRFNARIGPVFVFQNRIIRLFSWNTPSHTLSFLAIYSFLCLEPSLIAVVPLAVLLYFIMVPAFLVRHPPPPTLLPSDLDVYALGGPALAPAQKIKPAPELSKDFFRNMRDLQNSMDDFSILHDEILKHLTPPTNFSNEALSSTIFIFLFLASLLLFVSAHLIPWRFVFFLGGWAAIGVNHPTIQTLLHTPAHSEQLATQEKELSSQFNAFSIADTVLDPAPEKREVEVYELQHRDLYPSDAEWEPWVFTPNPYDPLTPAMLAGDRPKGTRFFEDVQPPKGWRWADKKWTLDLLSREWVEERCITGVEVEMEGERWVTDIKYDDDDEESIFSASSKSVKSPTKGKGHVKGKSTEKNRIVTWEEGSGSHKLGEWRRRRWIRLVERVALNTGTRDDGKVIANE